MKRIAISGNIASGKSTIQKILEEKGYKVLDTDDVAKTLLTVKNKKLYETFRNYDVFENGEFSRFKMGQLVFSDKNAASKISSIMHPQIGEIIKDFFEENENEKFLFVGIPLLFEAKMENLFDEILFIYADDEIRLKRLIKRNGYTTEHALARINSQIPQEEKIKKSDYLIKNNKGEVELKKQIEKWLSNKN